MSLPETKSPGPNVSAGRLAIGMGAQRGIGARVARGDRLRLADECEGRVRFWAWW